MTVTFLLHAAARALVARTTAVHRIRQRTSQTDSYCWDLSTTKPTRLPFRRLRCHDIVLAHQTRMSPKLQCACSNIPRHATWQAYHAAPVAADITKCLTNRQPMVCVRLGQCPLPNTFDISIISNLNNKRPISIININDQLHAPGECDTAANASSSETVYCIYWCWRGL